LGDVWICGKHRVLCGDATQEASYQALLGADQCVDALARPAVQRRLRQQRQGQAARQEPSDPERQPGRRVLRLPGGGTHPGAGTRCDGAVYIAMSSSELDVLQSAFRAAGGHWSTFIIWAKNTFTMGRADYQRQYEPMLYGWREGSKRHWCGDRDQGDVWQIKKPVKNDLHPCRPTLSKNLFSD
jgi:hypothetical protein